MGECEEIHVIQNGRRKGGRQALMDYVLLPKRMLGRLLDVKVWRGFGGSIC